MIKCFRIFVMIPRHCALKVVTYALLQDAGSLSKNIYFLFWSQQNLGFKFDIRRNNNNN